MTIEGLYELLPIEHVVITRANLHHFLELKTLKRLTYLTYLNSGERLALSGELGFEVLKRNNTNTLPVEGLESSFYISSGFTLGG